MLSLLMVLLQATLAVAFIPVFILEKEKREQKLIKILHRSIPTAFRHFSMSFFKAIFYVGRRVFIYPDDPASLVGLPQAIPSENGPIRGCCEL